MFIRLCGTCSYLDPAPWDMDLGGHDLGAKGPRICTFFPCSSRLHGKHE